MNAINAPNPRPSAFFQQFPSVAHVIPWWYEILVKAARDYTTTESKLPLLTKPHGGYQWQPHPCVSRAIERDWDDLPIGEIDEPLESLSDSSDTSGETGC
jgi:hypothetical protein